MRNNEELDFEKYKEHMILEHIKSKSAQDISIKVRSEQSKTLRMNAMLLFVVFLLLVGLYAIFYVNFDFDYEPIERDFKQKISSFGNFRTFYVPSDNEQIEQELILENGFESS